MSRGDPAARAVEPMVVDIECEGATHRISWRRSRLQAIDHDEDAERALTAFGGRAPHCLAVVRSWDRENVDLVAMLGGEGDYNPRREGLRNALTARSRAFAPGVAPADRVSALWDLPVRLRHRLVLHRAVEAGAPDDVVDLLVRLEDGRARLDRNAFRRLSAALGARPRPQNDEEAVLGRFFDGHRLTEIPAKWSVRRVVLARLAAEFAAGRDYSQADVKRILGSFHADHATLRRYLVDEGFLERSEGIYRVAAD